MDLQFNLEHLIPMMIRHAGRLSPEMGARVLGAIRLGLDAIRRLVDAGVPDIRQRYMAQTLEMGEFYAEIAAQYPKIAQYVQVFHPDLQGPMDIVEVIWGSSVFYSLYDRPDLVKALQSLEPGETTAGASASATASASRVSAASPSPCRTSRWKKASTPTAATSSGQPFAPS